MFVIIHLSEGRGESQERLACAGASGDAYKFYFGVVEDVEGEALLHVAWANAEAGGYTFVHTADALGERHVSHGHRVAFAFEDEACVRFGWGGEADEIDFDAFG